MEYARVDDTEPIDSGGERGIGVAILAAFAIFGRDCRAIFETEGSEVDEIVGAADSGGGRRRILG